MPRPLAVLLTVALATAILMMPARNASADPTATVSPSTVERGGSFTVSGNCWDPDYDPARHFEYEWSVGVSTGVPGGTMTFSRVTGDWSITKQVPQVFAPSAFSLEPTCRRSDGSIFHYPMLLVTVPPLTPIPTPVARPAPAAPTAAPRTATSTAPRTTAPPAAVAATTTTAAPTSAAAPVTPSAAPGCADCTRLTGDAAVTAGQELTLSYAGFQPGEQITLVMRSTPVTLGTFTADASGLVTADVRIPASAEPGSHTLTLSGPARGDLVVAFRVAAAQQRATAVASAGTDLALPLVLGGSVLVLVLGAGGFVVRRRRTAGAAQETPTPIAAPIA
jgi:hypothetical protein